MRILILGPAHDPTVTAVAQALGQSRGFASVYCAGLERLAASRWEHRLSPTGKVVTSITFADGESAAADVVFNRMESLSPLHFNGWSEVDAAYGRTEWFALLLSWLESLGDCVINRPAFGNLNGPADRAWMWLARAAAAGLPPHFAGATTSTRRFPPKPTALDHPALLPVVADPFPPINRAMGYADPAITTDVIVIGDAVFGDPAATPAHDGCRRLARAVATDVLSIRLAQGDTDGIWRFVAANPSPVIDGGEPLSALVALLEARAGVLS